VIQYHPTTIDFWLISVYVEFDLKGNLFSSRKLMLQALRNNEENPLYYAEYLRFEVAYLNKIMLR